MTNFKYCPRCGEVYGVIFYDDVYCDRCLETTSFFDRKKEKSNMKLIETNVCFEDWPVKKGELTTAVWITLKMYEYFWENYIDVPENDKLNREIFEANKAATYDFFNKGAIKIYTSNHPSQQQPKDASVIGRGVAGAIIAGPAGAVIGAASALDKNMKNANKKK